MQRILFVCTGNTCRSPMAEAILKSKNIAGLEVKSAGIFADHGSEASKNAKQVLDQNTIAHQHTSSALTKTQIEWADLILTMTTSHKYAILQAHPDSSGKLYTLKEFAGEPFDHDVTDPFGGNLAIYESTFQELSQLIEKVIEKIKPSS